MLDKDTIQRLYLTSEIIQPQADEDKFVGEYEGEHPQHSGKNQKASEAAFFAVQTAFASMEPFID